MIVDCRAGPQKNVQQHVASDGKSNTKLWMICLKMFLYTHNILTGMPAEVVRTNSGGYSVWKSGGHEIKNLDFVYERHAVTFCVMPTDLCSIKNNLALLL